MGRDQPAAIADWWPGCAGDGLPPPPRTRAPLPWSLQLSALAIGWGAAYAGRDSRITDLDSVDNAALLLGTARLGGCGALETGKGRFVWSVIYEPYDLAEAAQPDAREWGRFTSAEVGFAPWHWLTISAGIRKIAFSYGHDEPLELLTLPIRPYVSTSVAPDRRAGITLDDDFGVARVVIGVYEAPRDLTVSAAGGMLLTARLVAEPIGPVGNTVSTLRDPEFWRRRPRLAINASILYQYLDGSSTFALGADGAAHWGPIGVAGEYIYASDTLVEAPVRLLPRPSLSRQGLWLEAAAMLWRPYLEIAGRYDWLYNPNQAGQIFHAATAGLNAYAYKKYLKLQVSYTHKFHYQLAAGAPEIQDDLLLISGQLVLERDF